MALHKAHAQVQRQRTRVAEGRANLDFAHVQPQTLLYQPLNQGRANAPLDDMAQLCGFPGKLGMDGSKVWDAYQQGEIEAIRNYCETDVVNTYLVYLRFQLMRGHLTQAAYDHEIALVRDTLKADPAPHWQEFLAAWKA